MEMLVVRVVTAMLIVSMLKLHGKVQTGEGEYLLLTA